MSEGSSLIDRFGTTDYFEESFHGVNLSFLVQDFKNLMMKASDFDNYEIARQRFLKLLNKGKMIWHPGNSEHDLDVDFSRIYTANRKESIAFMRLKPGGFRSERIVPLGVQYLFICLKGKALFTNKSRPRLLRKGNYITIPAKNTYSVRSLTTDETSYFIFRMTDNRVDTVAEVIEEIQLSP